MKLKTLVILALCTASSAFAVNKKPIRDPFAPKDMVLVPGGTINLPESGLVTFAPFYIGEEVTNKEYREFVADIKSNPNQSLKRRIWRKDSQTGAFKDSLLVVKYSDVEKGLDYESNLPYKDYATDAKYDKYPVVGVSQIYAEYYAMWKTKTEEIKNANNNRPRNSLPYRITNTAAQKYIDLQGLKPISKERKLLDAIGEYRGFQLIKDSPAHFKPTSANKG